MTRFWIVACVGLALLGFASWGIAQTELEDKPLPKEYPNPSAWLAAPTRDGAISAQDRAARDTLLELIKLKRPDFFKADPPVVIAELPTGLPEDYDILLYGKLGDVLLIRLEINIRGDQATAELVTVEGIRRGSLPLKQTDLIARQFSYAFAAKQAGHPEPTRENLFSGGFHTRPERLELISRDNKRPFHLRTPHMATSWGEPSLGDSIESLLKFAYSNASASLEENARNDLKLQEPSEKLSNEVVSRLRKIATPEAAKAGIPKPAPPEENFGSLPPRIPDDQLPLDDRSRDDRAAVEALLYARLAIDWKVAAALPELQRLGMEVAATRLTVALDKDPYKLLIAAFSHPQYEVFRWANNHTVCNLPRVQATAVYIAALSQVRDGERAHQIVSSMDFYKCKLNAEQMTQLEKIFEEPPNEQTQVEVAGSLFRRTSHERYFNYLREYLARSDVSKDRRRTFFSRFPEEQALNAILETPAFHNKFREPTRELLLDLLRRMPHEDSPSIISDVVDGLEILANTDTRKILTEYSQHRYSTVKEAGIRAWAGLEPDEGLAYARKQIRIFTQPGETRDFETRVLPYLDLLFWKRDRDSLPVLEEISKIESNANEYPDYTPRVDALIAYLKSQEAKERLPFALEFIEGSRLSDDQLKEVGRLLVKEGADPKACQPLLEPDPKRPIRLWSYQPLYDDPPGPDDEPLNPPSKFNNSPELRP